MGRSLLSWVLGEVEGRSVFRDLRNGRAGGLVRFGLSLAAVGLCLSPTFLLLGLMETGGQGVRDHHVAIAMAGAAVLYGACLVAIWWTYRRFRHAIRGGVAVVTVWAFTIPVIVTLVEVMMRPEFLIAGVVTAAIGLTIAIVAITTYHGAAGHRIIDTAGAVRVECPACKYSMVGLSTTTCPECGAAFTVDEIIRAQGYQRDEDVEQAAEEEDEVPAAA